jgi:hypothetical protein
LLRAPDLKETPFPNVLAGYTAVGSGWVDLRAQMGIRVENAYFREGAPRRGTEGFIGTEVAEYRTETNGRLRLVSVDSKLQPKGAQHPVDQPPVQELLAESLARYRYHRYFYQVVFSKANGEVHGAVLLGAGSAKELAGLATRLLNDPDSVCTAKSIRCAVFPELCTVTPEIEIVVNGKAQMVRWGSLVGSVVSRPQKLQVLRSYGGRLTPVEIDSGDPNALRLPLLPGDHLDWE